MVGLTVRVDGELVEEREITESVSFELGEFAPGTEVVVVATAGDATAFVFADVTVNGCPVAQERCNEAGCTVTATGVVQPLDCRWRD